MTGMSKIRRMCLLLGAAIAMQTSAMAQNTPKVKFQTTQGEFVVELFPDKAPVTVQNFMQYVKDKHYDGTIFHRVIEGFMIQGGGFNATMTEKPTRAPIVLEARNGLRNDRGTIAMARTREPNSATAQFFVNVVDNNNLNAPQPDGNGYAVFGKVVSGMETVDKIRSASTTNKGMFQNVPSTLIVINSATLVK
jgi:peptidyl-prolyl cis-trans isomerase A (cyclophilin A)